MNTFQPRLMSIAIGDCDELNYRWDRRDADTKRRIQYKNLSLTRKVQSRRKLFVISHDFEMPMDLSPERLAKFGLQPKEST